MNIIPRGEEVAEIVAAITPADIGSAKERARVAEALRAGKYETPEGVAEVAAMLQAGEYETPEELAEALIAKICDAIAGEVASDLIETAAEVAVKGVSAEVIRRTADLLWFRDWYVIGAAMPEGVVAWGPIAGEPEALKLGGQLGGMALPREWGVLKIHGLGRIATNAKGGREGGGYGYCVTKGCGCPPYAHAMAGTSRGACIACKNCDQYQQSVTKRATTKKAKVTA